MRGTVYVGIVMVILLSVRVVPFLCLYVGVNGLFAFVAADGSVNMIT